MAESVQIAVFEGGNLSVMQAREKDPEVVLALPLNRLLVKMVRVPAENREDPVAYATPILQAMSPYPDEPLTVTCETVGETEAGLTVIAAALPESAADDIGAALDAGKYSATRIDALALGQLRELWGALDDGRADTTLAIKAAATPTDPTSPQTGDTSHMGLWVSLLCVSGAALAASTASVPS